MVAIFLNIEISIDNPSLAEEANTLSVTLLPYLNQVKDYSLMKDKDHFTASRFLNSIVRHVIDTKSHVGMGFMLYGLKYDPSKLIELAPLGNNREALAKALVYNGFSKSSASVMAEHPGKFLWLELLKFFEGKME